MSDSSLIALFSLGMASTLTALFWPFGARSAWSRNAY